MYQMRQKGVSRVELLAQERELIHALELFACVPPEELDAQLAQAGCGVHVFARGEVIYGGQDFQRSLGVLLSGRAAVHKETDDGRGLAISTLQAGQIFGAAAIFNDAEAFTNVITALEPCRVLLMEQNCLRALMQRYFCVAEAYIRYLSGRILFLNDRIAALAAGTAEQRVAHFLAQNGPRVTLSMTALASRLNIGRASLYRVLDRLIAAGAIEKQGKTIVIKRPELLFMEEA